MRTPHITALACVIGAMHCMAYTTNLWTSSNSLVTDAFRKAELNFAQLQWATQAVDLAGVTNAVVVDAAARDVSATNAAVIDAASRDVAATNAAMLDAAVRDNAATNAAVTDAKTRDVAATNAAVLDAASRIASVAVSAPLKLNASGSSGICLVLSNWPSASPMSNYVVWINPAYGFTPWAWLGSEPANDNAGGLFLRKYTRELGHMHMGDPLSNTHAATKGWVEAATNAVLAAAQARIDAATNGLVAGNYVAKSGDTMTGDLLLTNAESTVMLDVATYSGIRASFPISGHGGYLLFEGTKWYNTNRMQVASCVESDDAAPKLYVDTGTQYASNYVENAVSPRSTFFVNGPCLEMQPSATLFTNDIGNPTNGQYIFTSVRTNTVADMARPGLYQCTIKAGVTAAGSFTMHAEIYCVTNAVEFLLASSSISPSISWEAYNDVTLSVTVTNAVPLAAGYIWKLMLRKDTSSFTPTVRILSGGSTFARIMYPSVVGTGATVDNLATATNAVIADAQARINSATTTIARAWMCARGPAPTAVADAGNIGASLFVKDSQLHFAFGNAIGATGITIRTHVVYGPFSPSFTHTNQCIRRMSDGTETSQSILHIGTNARLATNYVLQYTVSANAGVSLVHYTTSYGTTAAICYVEYQYSQ